MVAAPILAAILTQVFGLHRQSYIFFAEAFGVYAFAAYWLVKTLEIRETNADRQAAEGKLLLPAGAGVADAVREVRVTSKAPNVVTATSSSAY